MGNKLLRVNILHLAGITEEDKIYGISQETSIKEKLSSGEFDILRAAININSIDFIYEMPEIALDDKVFRFTMIVLVDRNALITSEETANVMNKYDALCEENLQITATNIQTLTVNHYKDESMSIGVPNNPDILAGSNAEASTNQMDPLG